MGSFHCIPSGCASVVYQEYLPPTVRWRYPGEDWQQIEGDRFELVEETSQFKYTPRKSYRPVGKVRVATRVPIDPPYGSFPAKYSQGEELTLFIPGAYPGPILDFKVNRNSNNLKVEITYNKGSGGNSQGEFCSPETVVVDWFSISADGDRAIPQTNGTHFSTPTVDWNYGVYDQALEIAPEYNPKACLEIVEVGCHFSVFKGEEKVYHRVESLCPEAEVLPCRLNDKRQVIKIEKIPYLERAEVIDWAYQNLGLNVYRAPIPDECLNIYRNTTVTIIPQFEGFPTPTNSSQANYGYIAQICSAVGCPPPEYQVLCNCDCVDCPPGTCAVECEGVICCYDTTTGIAQATIPLDNYCGGTTDY